MSNSPSVLASWVLAIVRCIESYGANAKPLLYNANIDTSVLEKNEARVPLGSTNKLWGLAVNATGDELIGIRVPNHITFNSLYGVDAAAQTSNTLRDLVHRVCRFSKIVTSGANLYVEETHSQCKWILKTDHTEAPCIEAMDAYLATIFSKVCPLLSHPNDFFKQVCVVRSRPADSNRYEDVFGCKVLYDSDHYSIVMNPKMLDAKLAGANPHLAKLSEELLVPYLVKFEHTDIEMLVRSAVLEYMPTGSVNKAKIAKHLHMSVRSLGRKLQTANITFTQLFDGIRSEKAIHLIRQGYLSQGEIAYRLGFIDSSSFCRAFRRWTGLSPGQYQEKIKKQNVRPNKVVGTQH